MWREGRKVFISDLVLLLFTVNLCRLLGRTRSHTALHFWRDGGQSSSLTLGSRNAKLYPNQWCWLGEQEQLYSHIKHGAWWRLLLVLKNFWGFADIQGCMYVTVHKLGISPGENNQSSRTGQYRHSVHDISSCKDKSLNLLLPFKTLHVTRLYSFKTDRALFAVPHSLAVLHSLPMMLWLAKVIFAGHKVVLLPGSASVCAQAFWHVLVSMKWPSIETCFSLL